MTRGEVYYIKNLKLENGCMQKPDRPAVIVSNGMLNAISTNVKVCYLTVNPANDMPTHVTIRSTGCVSTILCEMLENVHISRIGTKVGELTEAEMRALDAALAIALGIDFGGTEPNVVEKPVEKIVEKVVVREPTNEEIEAKAREIMANEKENAPVMPDPDEAKGPILPMTSGEDIVKCITAETMLSIAREDNIRLETERNLYRDLYHNLLNKLMGDGE